jgi:hypothetical protein
MKLPHSDVWGFFESDLSTHFVTYIWRIYMRTYVWMLLGVYCMYAIQAQGHERTEEHHPEGFHSVHEVFLKQDMVELQSGSVRVDADVDYSNHHPTGELREETLLMSGAVYYGATNRLTLFASIPFEWRIDQEGSNGIRVRDTLQHVSAGAQYTISHEAGHWPEVTWSGVVAFPTTTSKSRAALPGTYTGWRGLTSISFVKSFDPVYLIARVGASLGGPHGGVGIEYMAGVGVTITHDFDASVNIESRLSPTHLGDRFSQQALVRLSVTYLPTHNIALDPYVRFGLTADSPDYTAGLGLSCMF